MCGWSHNSWRNAMTFTDVRGFIDRVEDLGELRTVRGAHWDLEVGGITELAQHQINGPAVLFDDIPDYPSGSRVFINSMGSASRTALVLGLPTGLSMRELLPLWRERSKQINPIPMNYVKDGPVMENVLEGNDIDMYKFPTPRWHELDGGRYIGTGSFDATLDLESDWITLGCYPAM